MFDRKEAKEIGIYFQDYVFKVSEDDLIVYLDTPLISSEEKKKFGETWPSIKAYLSEGGLKLLLDYPEESDGKIIVAKGHLPKEGSPEKIELLPKFSRLREGGDVEEFEIAQKEDLRERFQKIICAEKDEAIAKWYPALPPTPGINVWGDPIEPPPLKMEKDFQLGPNLYLDEKDLHIKARTSGVVTFEKGVLDIHPEYVLKGDVSYNTGNIHFIGNKLVINGDIKFGFTVTCRGDMELKGCTENKTRIEVEGNFISEGILRGEETLVKVKGVAKVKGVEFANLEIWGDLIIKDYLVFSNTLVYGHILATEGKGIIYGGKVQASGNIEAKIVGHPAQTKTELLAGYRPDTIDEYLQLSERELLYTENLKKINYGLELSKKLREEGRISKDKEKIIEKLITEKAKIEKNLEAIRETLNNLRANLQDLRKSKIRIWQKIYPNVILGIADYKYTVDTESNGPITYYLEDSSIKVKKD